MQNLNNSILTEHDCEVMVFVPVYNEIENFDLICRNIRKFRKIIPNVSFLFSDNCSTDGTWEALQKLRQDEGDCIRLHAQPINAGFARNLLTASQIPNETIVILFSANDEVYTPGLRKLWSQIREVNADFYLTNWAYIKRMPSGRARILSRGDIHADFIAESLDDFFSKQPYAPIGIGQYTAKAKYFRLLEGYQSWESPQCGMFFEAFPCRMAVLGAIPLALGLKTEDSGWRSSGEKILKMHMTIAKEILTLLRSARDLQHIDNQMYRLVRTRYLQVPVVIVLSQYMHEGWGSYELSCLRRFIFAFVYVWKSFDLAKITEDSIGERLLICRIILRVLFAKLCNTVLPHPVRRRLKAAIAYVLRKVGIFPP